MTTPLSPGSILRPTVCPTCGQSHLESGGHYTRTLRDLQGVRQVKVQRLRCASCHKTLECIYPEGVQHARWYSVSVQALFAILAVHQVDQACRSEVAALLGYPLVPDTQDAWQDTQALRAERDHQARLTELRHQEVGVKIASIDEFKLGDGWAYSLTDTSSQAVLTYRLSDRRNEEVVRDLISTHPPQVTMADGCPSIAGGVGWYGDIKQGRCWFHVMQALSKRVGPGRVELKLHSGETLEVSKRQRLVWDVQSLYRCASLDDAERFLAVLRARHGVGVLEPLVSAWPGLRLRWLVPGLPLTNNTSETLYRAVWGRTRRRVVQATERARAWLTVGMYRWNHHEIRGRTPWERLTGQPSPCWLDRLTTPLGRAV